jgi:hypothetical protein
MGVRQTLGACGLHAVLVFALAAVSSGCAGERANARSREGSRSKSSTVGSDLRQAPAGTTIPPPSLGVDLVRYWGELNPARR